MHNAGPIAPLLLNTEEASRLLGFSAKTLAYWRARSEGPKYVRFGDSEDESQRASVRYRYEDLVAFVNAHVVTP